MDSVKYALKSSPSFDAIQPTIVVVCAQWPFVAKERSMGDLRTKTPNPVLFVGNICGAATAIGSAYKMSELLKGSIVLEHKGFGVSSASIHSSSDVNTNLSTSTCLSLIIWILIQRLSGLFVEGVTPDKNIM